jgi:hypothetical protein
MSKGKKKKSVAAIEHKRAQMRLVTSDTCAVCKTPCVRGMAYLERMRSPGELGTGVPCILTVPARKA